MTRRAASTRRLTGRFAVAAAAVAMLIAPTLAPAAAASTSSDPGPGYRVGDYADGRAMSILPPGENGLVNATDAAKFETTKARPPNSDDQLGKYKNLLYGSSTLTDAGLSSYFNDESFGVPPGEVTRTEKLPGVTIYRDTSDVPHVFGDTDQSMAFGAGYAQAEDRLFLMDVLRHYGSGTLASFLGASCQFEQMDHDELLLAPYTPERAQQQIDNLPKQYGDQGTLAKSAVESYVQGVNAYIAATQTDPRLLPADYGAALGPPMDWAPKDVVAVAGLIGGIFGKGGGGEIANAGLLQYLQGKLGEKPGRAAFDQLKSQNDPGAPTTSDKSFPYEIPGKVDPATTAMPNKASAPLTGGPTATTPGCDLTNPNPAGMAILNSLKAMPSHMSNALVVNANRTAENHPTAVFGPQVSYFAPQILSLADLHSPHYSAMGASFPGTGLIELGRGPDFAWSATSAGSDLIDQRLEQICDPGGGKPQSEGKYYLFNGVCTPMIHELFSEAVGPKPGGPGAPAVIDHDIYRTGHGVVQGWTTSGTDTHPVAVVNQRSTYEHDIDSVVGFLHWGQPALTHDVNSWMQGAAEISYTFNWFYVDSKDTGYFTSGKDPVRPLNVDPNLPSSGIGNAEWQGFLPDAQHVQEINPTKGYFVSWNNKPAKDFSAADDQYGYGPVFRSQTLVNQLKAQLDKGPVTRAQVVQAMEGGASQDLDWLQVLPALLQYLNGRSEPAGVTDMLTQLTSWLGHGAHRLKASPGDKQYADHAAVAIMDELEPLLVHAVFDQLLLAGGMSNVGSNGGATTEGYKVLPMQFVNTPNSGGAHLGSAYDGGYEGYLQKTLQQLAGTPPADAFGSPITEHTCGTNGQADCGAAIDKALQGTYDALVKANGSPTPSTWTASTESNAAKETMPIHDSIAFKALGIVGQPNIDWQNRPTFQQVVQFPRHRTSDADTGTVTPSPGGNGGAGGTGGTGGNGGAGGTGGTGGNGGTTDGQGPVASNPANGSGVASGNTANGSGVAPGNVAPRAVQDNPSSASGGLAFTGFDAVLALALGCVAIAGGAVAMTASRRRGKPAAESPGG